MSKVYTNFYVSGERVGSAYVTDEEQLQMYIYEFSQYLYVSPKDIETDYIVAKAHDMAQDIYQ